MAYYILVCCLIQFRSDSHLLLLLYTLHIYIRFTVLFIDIAVLPGAVQRNCNKVHGLRRAESYGYSILQSLCGLFDVRSKSTRVSVLSNSSCLDKLDPNLSLESCYYKFRYFC